MSGSNGSCSPSYLCTAGIGYDGPTGLGTPIGTAAFGSGTVPTPTPTPGPTPTPTPTPVPTATPAPGQPVVNGGFETGTFAPWIAGGGAPTPAVSSAQAHSGTHSTLLGTAGGNEPTGDSSVPQTVAIPASATTATLSFWYYGGTTDTVTYDWQEAQIRSASGTSTLAQAMPRTASNARAWTRVTFDMTGFRGQTVQLYFNVHQDGYGDLTYMYLDDVSLVTG